MNWIPVSLLTFMYAFLNEVLYSNAALKKCPAVNDIAVERNFSFERFKGLWFTQKFNKFVPIRRNGVDIITNHEFSNLQSYLKKNPKNPKEWVVENAGQHALSKKCFDNEGKVTFQPDQKAKLRLAYDLGHGMSHNFNYWVLYTDYSNFAMVYSCQEESVEKLSSPCDKSKSYIWTITRKATGHSKEEIAFIKNATDYLCLRYDDLKDVKHDKSCLLNKSNPV